MGEEEIVFSVPVYRARYLGPSEVDFYELKSKGLKFGEFYSIKLGHRPGPLGLHAVRVVDLDADYSYRDWTDLADDWELPNQLRGR